MSVLKTKIVTIRKPRRCFGCLERLSRGDKATIQTNVDMGCMFDITLCDTCQSIVSEMDSSDFFLEGDLKEEANEIRATQQTRITGKRSKEL